MKFKSLGACRALFVARAGSRSGAVLGAGRAVVLPTTSDPQHRNAPERGPALRVAPRKRVCGVAVLGKGITLAGAPRLASIAFWAQRARRIKSGRLLALAAALLLSTNWAMANEALIRKTLLEKFPGASIASVAPTPYSGLFEVYLDGQLIYVDAKAKYLFSGDVIDLKTRSNLTQARLDKLNAVKWESLPLGNAIKTVKGSGARHLAVFSDVDCPYCRRFDAELDKIDNVTVYTFLYPVEGLHPKAVQASRQIWCAPDKNRAWDDYVKSGKVPSNDGKCKNPVDDNLALGNKLRVSGTPTIIFRNGQRIPGLVPAAKLEQLLTAAQK